MQPIQDKDFDKLFKTAFDDAEIMPSRDLWSSIEKEIEPKKKRIIPIYWLSAAAVAVIATVGFLVYQQQEVKPKQYANHVAPKAMKPIDKAEPVKRSEDIVVPVEKETQDIHTSSKPAEALAKIPVKEKIQQVEKQKVVMAPEMQKQETMIAKAEEPKQDLKAKIDAAILQPKEETVIAMVQTTNGDQNEDNDQNKGIRNVGDVVNLIVNKMDKRKDKIIQFRTDDDDSSISSINIGPFKFGKKKR